MIYIYIYLPSCKSYVIYHTIYHMYIYIYIYLVGNGLQNPIGTVGNKELQLVHPFQQQAIA